MRRAIDEVVGQGAGCGVAAAVGEFGLQDAGRAGAEKDADPVLAVLGDGFSYLVAEAIGFQPHLRQAVVAAVVVGQGRRQLFIVDAGHLADPGVEFHRLKGARRQAATAGAQGVPGGVKAAAEAAGGGEGGKQQRGQGWSPDKESKILAEP